MSQFQYKSLTDNITFYSHHIDTLQANEDGVLTIADGHGVIPDVPNNTYEFRANTADKQLQIYSTQPEKNGELNKRMIIAMEPNSVALVGYYPDADGNQQPSYASISAAKNGQLQANGGLAIPYINNFNTLSYLGTDASGSLQVLYQGISLVPYGGDLTKIQPDGLGGLITQDISGNQSFICSSKRYQPVVHSYNPAFVTGTGIPNPTATPATLATLTPSSYCNYFRLRGSFQTDLTAASGSGSFNFYLSPTPNGVYDPTFCIVKTSQTQAIGSGVTFTIDTVARQPNPISALYLVVYLDTGLGVKLANLAWKPTTFNYLEQMPVAYS